MSLTGSQGDSQNCSPPDEIVDLANELVESMTKELVSAFSATAGTDWTRFDKSLVGLEEAMKRDIGKDVGLE